MITFRNPLLFSKSCRVLALVLLLLPLFASAIPPHKLKSKLSHARGHTHHYTNKHIHPVSSQNFATQSDVYKLNPKTQDEYYLTNVTLDGKEYEPPMVSDPKIQDLVDYATSLVGVSYRFAGESPETGFDCSGYVQYVYKHEFGITLPHNAAAISQFGDKIPKLALKPGDLVLFKTLRRTFSHIGIYLGDHLFAHASSTKTGYVEISDMRESYWVRRFVGARRLALESYTHDAKEKNSLG